MKPPPRLLDDTEAAPELRRDLQRVKSAPSNYDVAAGLVGLQSVIASSLGPAAGTGHAASSSAAANGASTAVQAAAGTKTVGLLGAMGTKLAAVVVGSVAVAAATVTAIHWNAQPAESTRARDTVVHDAAIRASQPSPELPSAGPSASVVIQATVPSATPPAPVAALRSAPHEEASADARRVRTAAASSDAVRLEIAQLGQIKAALEHDPARAYRLAEAGHRKFVNGVMTQEREALAILALLRLDRRTEGERRAHTFLERYPQSPLRERVERALRSESE